MYGVLCERRKQTSVCGRRPHMSGDSGTGRREGPRLLASGSRRACARVVRACMRAAAWGRREGPRLLASGRDHACLRPGVAGRARKWSARACAPPLGGAVRDHACLRPGGTALACARESHIVTCQHVDVTTFYARVCFPLAISVRPGPGWVGGGLGLVPGRLRDGTRCSHDDSP